MKTVNIVLLVLILLIAIGIGGYFALERAAHERDLRNYPTAYTELVRSYAEEFSLDPYLVTAIMRCESSNDPNAVSKKGAIGLMQIMPDTGAWIAHKQNWMKAIPRRSFTIRRQTSGLRAGIWRFWNAGSTIMRRALLRHTMRVTEAWKSGFPIPPLRKTESF